MKIVSRASSFLFKVLTNSSEKNILVVEFFRCDNCWNGASIIELSDFLAPMGPIIEILGCESSILHMELEFSSEKLCFFLFLYFYFTEACHAFYADH